VRRFQLFAVVTISFAAVLLVVFFQPRAVLRLLSRHEPDVLYFVTSREKVVALTIDDAPHALVTPQLLDVLRENGAHATFFVIGDHAPGNSHILERARLEAHELGNHLAHEFPSVFLTPTQFEKELTEVDRLIGPFRQTKWFRPGSGWYSRRMLNQAKMLGYRCALGSVFPYDTLIRNTRAISMYIKSQIFPGAVIVIHDGKPDRVRSADVLKEVLPALKAAGYRVVTLSELVEIASRES
jgi:peptidoglycan-N-acetylglucosamine deacetylase